MRFALFRYFMFKIHTIAEPLRGACLEAVVTRLMAYNPRIIAVTATCSNISDVRELKVSITYCRLHGGYQQMSANACANGMP